MKSSDDLQMLMAEIKGGSVEAFDAFYEQMAPFVISIALKLTNDKREAEDVCHDVFLEVYLRPAGYDPTRGSIKAWLAIKTKSRSLDRLRKQQRVVVAEPKENRLPVFMNPALSTEETVLSKVEREVLERAMERIPGAQKQALSEKFFDSRTQKEIAASMERPVGTVKSLIRYGIRNVRKQLRQLGWSDPSSKGGGSRGL